MVPFGVGIALLVVSLTSRRPSMTPSSELSSLASRKSLASGSYRNRVAWSENATREADVGCASQRDAESHAPATTSLARPLIESLAGDRHRSATPPFLQAMPGQFGEARRHVDYVPSARTCDTSRGVYFILQLDCQVKAVTTRLAKLSIESMAGSSNGPQDATGMPGASDDVSAPSVSRLGTGSSHWLIRVACLRQGKCVGHAVHHISLTGCALTCDARTATQ